jgi:SAM-dependent methyltransferase
MSATISDATLEDIFAAMRNETLGGRPLVNLVGGGDGIGVGRGMMAHLVSYAAFSENDHILDFGCGCGRVAAVLAQRISDAGSYTGFDINAGLVNFAHEKISSLRPNFRFLTLKDAAAATDDKSIPKSKIISDVGESYTPGAVDLCVATSLFTHVSPGIYRAYLQHIESALKPSGRTFMTAFLIDPTVRGIIQRGNARLTFKHVYDEEGFYLEDVRMPWHAVAVGTEKLRQLVFDAGLYVEKILSGVWPGRPFGTDFQDLVVLRKIPR